MKFPLILLFTPLVLGTPFLGNLFKPRGNNESHISDFRDKTKAQLQLQEDNPNDTPDEVVNHNPPQMDGMRRKIQLYGRLFGKFIGALQDGIEDTSRWSSSAESSLQFAKFHLSPTQEEKGTRKIDAEEMSGGSNHFERLVADGQRWQEETREKKLVFLMTNILPNLISTWRSAMQAIKLHDSMEKSPKDTVGLNDEGLDRLQLDNRYLPARENSWEALRNILRSINKDESSKNAKIQEEPPPKLNAVVMLELFGTIFGVTWNILSQLGTLLRN